MNSEPGGFMRINKSFFGSACFIAVFNFMANGALAQNVATAPIDNERGVISYAPLLQSIYPAVVRIVALVPANGAASSAPSAAGKTADQTPSGISPREQAIIDAKKGLAPQSPGQPPNRPTPSAPQFRPASSGSGVIIDAQNGIILTNQHVVEGSTALRVELSDGRTFDAQLLGADEATDVAVIKIDAPRLNAVAVANSDSVKVGDLVFALGYPRGLDQTLTVGVVSGLGRSGIGDGLQDYIQTDAAVNSGNSGGPLLDSRGRLIGINTAILSSTGWNAGIAFAVPTRIALSISDQIRRTGTVRRGRVGLQIAAITAEQARTMTNPSTKGALITEISPEGPAARAGLRSGDIIIRAQGRQIDTPGALSATIGIAEPGANIELSYRRDDREFATRLQVEAPQRVQVATAAPTTGGNAVVFGAQFRDVTAEDRIPNGASGAMIVFVTPGSVAARRNIYPGDVVVAINRRPIRNAAELTAALRTASGATQLMISRGGTLVPIVVQE